LPGKAVGNPRQSAAPLGHIKALGLIACPGADARPEGGVADSLDEAKAALDGAPGREPVSVRFRRKKGGWLFARFGIIMVL